MPGCCDPGLYDEAFNDASVRRRAAAYRRRGLDRLSSHIVDQVVAHGVVGRTVLEIGAGLGNLSIELLRRGAAAATCVELATTYETQAAALAAEAGVGDRMVRRRVDLAADPRAVAEADVVVLNKVVCCYPDDVALLGAAAALARELVVLSFPRSDAVTRAFVAVFNGALGLTGTAYRGYAHPQERMFATLARHGLEAATVRQGLVWQVAAGVRQHDRAPA